MRVNTSESVSLPTGGYLEIKRFSYLDLKKRIMYEKIARIG
jgi:hypothetical protein